MNRTKANLQLMNELQEKRRRDGIDVEKEGPYEVTQVINSFLGALVHPWEALLRKDDGRSLAQVARLERYFVRSRT